MPDEGKVPEATPKQLFILVAVGVTVIALGWPCFLLYGLAVVPGGGRSHLLEVFICALTILALGVVVAFAMLTFAFLVKLVASPFAGSRRPPDKGDAPKKERNTMGRPSSRAGLPQRRHSQTDRSTE